jgi:hypothetical protein
MNPLKQSTCGCDKILTKSVGSCDGQILQPNSFVNWELNWIEWLMHWNPATCGVRQWDLDDEP